MKRRRQPLRQEFRNLPAEIASIRLGWRRVILFGVLLGVLIILSQYGMQIVIPQHIPVVPSWNLG